ncbi:MAG: electron transport complex subunit RsxC [bacterium]|nr:electron transport complex subunit RsxC [bacterium]
MNLLTFKGGIHPKEEKFYTQDKVIREMPRPTKVVIPLRQHIGAPCEIKVAKGDEVKIGQVVGSSPTYVCANIHASISGKVVDIASMPHPTLGHCLCVVIESALEDKWVEVEHHRDWEHLTNEKLRTIIKEAGIVGLGGATFPTHVKLSPPEDKPIDTVILNGAECEPYLTSDQRIMMERAKDIAQGLKIIMKILSAKAAFIAGEINKPSALSLMAKAIKGEKDIEVMPLETKYPQGSEKQLIKAVLNREVPSGKLPLDVGVVVQNVGTALAIMEAVVLGKPLIDRTVTVTGLAIKEPQNLRVRIGTLFQDVIDACGGFDKEPGKIIMGGPMMGIAQKSTDVPVIKGTSGILVLPKKEVNLSHPRDCIRCGRCIEICPMRLMPNMLGILVERARWEEAKTYHLLDCIECGSCGYACPSNRSLVHFIKLGKFKISKK